jgi:hypothetical protein
LFWAEESNWVFDMPTSDIYRADLDGRNRMILVRLRFMFVSGLTLDVVRRKIYIADHYKHSLESMSYVGTDRYTIATSEVRIKKLLILIKL